MSASILDVGAQRRQEAEQTVQALSNMALSQPYRGTFLVPGAPVVLFGADAPMINRAFAESVIWCCQHWGAEVIEPSKIYDDSAPFSSLGLAKTNQEPPPPPPVVLHARQDILQIVATITEDIEQKCTPHTVMEAVAETMRVLLAGAIITAKDDLTEDDEVRVHFRTGPRFEIFPDVDDNTIYVAGRARLGVTRKANPALSYLLGSNPSESQTLNIKLPNPRLFCGVDRLRFLDLRSPGHLIEEELVKVTA